SKRKPGERAWNDITFNGAARWNSMNLEIIDADLAVIKFLSSHVPSFFILLSVICIRDEERPIFVDSVRFFRYVGHGIRFRSSAEG
ncbi:MAG TPA: hypothetical protein PKM72_13420, partial [Nitrospirales bacterium]|nr:hypothetical protein [Nitrospirales bacterium]